MNIESLRRFVPAGMKLSEPSKEAIKKEEKLSPKPLEKPIYREPEIFSDPLALEIHITSTRCTSCQATFTSPGGAFMEVSLKRLMGVYYRDVGRILLPLPAQPPKSLEAVPHRIRRMDTTVSVCPLCMDHVETYEKQETPEESRPDVLTSKWFKEQREVNPDGAKLRELIQNIEAREAGLSGEDVRKNRVPEIRELFTNVGIIQKCDPEEQWES